MDIVVSILLGRKEVKESMLITQGKKMVTPTLSDDAFEVQLLGQHSTLESMKIKVLVYGMKERPATHYPRHERIEKFISTSRPDNVEKGIDDTTGSRYVKMVFGAKRLIEVMTQRLCRAAWCETRAIADDVVRQVQELDPLLGRFLATPCERVGYCTEVRDPCHYYLSDACKKKYDYFKQESERLKRQNNGDRH